jgi:hypothetical protein
MKNWTLKPVRSGKLARGRSRTVANPFTCVGISPGPRVTSGVERMKTSAPRTEKPRVSET